MISGLKAELLPENGVGGGAGVFANDMVVETAEGAHFGTRTTPANEEARQPTKDHALAVLRRAFAATRAAAQCGEIERPAEPASVRFAEMLIAGYGIDADLTWILDYTEVHLALQANPDGRKMAEAGQLWRKNLNENYCGATSPSE